MNGYKIVLLKAIFMLYRLPECERVCSGICTTGCMRGGNPLKKLAGVDDLDRDKVIL